MIDDEDFNEVSKYKWSGNRQRQVIAHVKGADGLTTAVPLGRFVWSLHHKDIQGNVKHKDGNPLNCQKANLYTKASAIIEQNKPYEPEPYPEITNTRTVMVNQLQRIGDEYVPTPTLEIVGQGADGKWYHLNPEGKITQPVTMNAYLEQLEPTP